MILPYLDTSALVKRYDPEEPGAEEVRTLFTEVRAVLTSSLAVVEAVSAFRIKERQGVLTPEEVRLAVEAWRPTPPCSTAWCPRSPLFSERPKGSSCATSSGPTTPCTWPPPWWWQGGRGGAAEAPLLDGRRGTGEGGGGRGSGGEAGVMPFFSASSVSLPPGIPAGAPTLACASMGWYDSMPLPGAKR